MGWSEHAANVHTEGLEESQSLFIKDWERCIAHVYDETSEAPMPCINGSLIIVPTDVTSYYYNQESESAMMWVLDPSASAIRNNCFPSYLVFGGTLNAKRIFRASVCRCHGWRQCGKGAHQKSLKAKECYVIILMMPSHLDRSRFRGFIAGVVSLNARWEQISPIRNFINVPYFIFSLSWVILSIKRFQSIHF